MKRLSFQNRTLALLVVLLPLVALFLYVALRSGPLAPVPVTVKSVENRAISPAMFGIGTVEARYTYKIGPTYSGRVKRLKVQVGDQVTAGEILGEMDPVDLDERIRAQEAAQKRAEAQLREARVHQAYAKQQAGRYEQLLAARSTSEEIVSTKLHDLKAAEEVLVASEEEFSRIRAEREALIAQRHNLLLLAPVNGLVTLRNADPGSTVVAGQSAVEVIDPTSIWINVRFDQIHAQGLAPELPAQIVLRSQKGNPLNGRVLRVEPLADPVTEETLAKVVFDQIPQPLPSIGELAEITITLPPLPESPIIPDAAIQRNGERMGVWQVTDGSLHFAPVSLGRADLEGNVQVREGLKAGDQVVVYSANSLQARSRIRVVDHIPGVKP